ncbi:hypothetical protein TrRE_jg13454 [Triparma retinervis]|uniref:Uncharacterized protein n=1 Tax=Triparma retinervis TaxID=2557542 RepID=A0A9W7AMT4_9STRA|nr:hypothetical protein TrRE_jg13454 [Triparma retinervis]
MDTVDDSDVLELGQDGAFDLSEVENIVKNLDTPPTPPNANKLKPSWQGMQSHSGGAGPEGPAEEVAPWEEYKTQGNEAFSKNDIDGARVFYTKALAEHNVVGTERAKILSNRALCALRESLPASSSILPATFTIRDISRNKEAPTATKQLLMQAVTDCSGAMSELHSSKSNMANQMLKTLHRKSLGYAMLGDHAKSLQCSTESESFISPSTPLSLSQSIKDLQNSLKQVGKDYAAISTALEATAALVMKDSRINPSRACIASSIACGQAGGSMEAICGVAAATAWNIVLDVYSSSSGETSDPEVVHKALSDFCESVAKAVHYHKGATKDVALGIFDVLSGKTVCDSVKLAKGSGLVPLTLRKEALRGAGVASAMLMSLRSERIEDVRKECIEGVKVCGGGEREGNEIAKMFGNGEGADESEEDDGFEPAASWQGCKPGKVYKLDEKGLGYYNDTGPNRGPAGKRGGGKKIKEDRLLDPNHPAFKDMNPSQVKSLEEMLRLTDEEVESIAGDQAEMIKQFRNMWKSNPESFKNYKKAELKEEGDAKKKKEAIHDPTKWMADHKEGLNWFTQNHGSFDKQSFLKQEKEREERQREESEKKSAERRAVIEKEANELFGKSKGGKDMGTRGENPKKPKKAKGTKKKGKKDDKKTQLKELLSWAS